MEFESVLKGLEKSPGSRNIPLCAPCQSLVSRMPIWYPRGCDTPDTVPLRKHTMGLPGSNLRFSLESLNLQPTTPAHLCLGLHLCLRVYWYSLLGVHRNEEIYRICRLQGGEQVNRRGLRSVARPSCFPSGIFLPSGDRRCIRTLLSFLLGSNSSVAFLCVYMYRYTLI